jgi:hypothetical protein
MERTNGKASGAEAWLALHHRNLDALNEASKRALERTQAIAIEHVDLVSDAHRHLAELLWCGARSGANGDLNSCLTLAKEMVDNSLTRSLALAEMTTRVQLDGFAVFKRSVSEMLELLQPTMAAAPRAGGDEG